MDDLTKRAKRVLSPVLGKYFEDFEVEKGRGPYLIDYKGKRYLDFATGIACCATGHCHPKVVSAIKKQAENLLHTCIGVAYYEPYIKLAEELQKIAPMKEAQVFLCQSGTEAVEAAIKLAKYVTKKPGIIAFKGGFHGRTLGALSVTTSKMKYREGYEPLLSEVYVSPFDLAVVEGLIKTHRVAGIIIEPILGEGGYLVVEKEFLKGLRNLCDRYNILLIFDEVQTGIGRTGKWFACEHSGVIPDVITIAKGIASGLPLGACVASAKVMAGWAPGAHGSTFGGNPVCCAAAIATLEVIRKEKLLQNATEIGNYLKKELLKLQTKYSKLIKEVRGIGLMLGVDFSDSETVKKIRYACLEKGLVLIATGGEGTVIRFIPPLNITKELINKSLRIFESVLSKIGKQV